MLFSQFGVYICFKFASPRLWVWNIPAQTWNCAKPLTLHVVVFHTNLLSTFTYSICSLSLIGYPGSDSFFINPSLTISVKQNLDLIGQLFYGARPEGDFGSVLQAIEMELLN